MEATLTLSVEPSGEVAGVSFAWKGWRPAAKMRRCAARKVRAWKLPASSGDAPRRCQAALSLAPP